MKRGLKVSPPRWGRVEIPPYLDEKRIESPLGDILMCSGILKLDEKRIESNAELRPSDSISLILDEKRIERFNG